MPNTVRIGTILGARVEAHASWLVALALMVATLAVSWLPQVAPGLPLISSLVLGIVSAALYVGLVLAHELAHVLAARYFGRAITSITLYPWGGMHTIEGEPTGSEIAQIALAGPLLNLAIAALAEITIPLFYENPVTMGLVTTVRTTSILLGLLNLLPGLPLDMGDVLRAILDDWKKVGNSVHVSWLAGRIIAAGLALWGLAQLIQGHGVMAVWLLAAGIALLAHPGLASPVAYVRERIKGLAHSA